MADAVWPVTLPQELLLGVDETPPVLVIRTEMDVGPAKVRRRSTANVRVFEPPPLYLTRDQVAIFDEFFLDTLKGGALTFAWKHPRTGNPIDFRIVGQPRYHALAPRQAAGDLWTVALVLEALPGTEVLVEPPPPPPPDEGLAMAMAGGLGGYGDEDLAGEADDTWADGAGTELQLQLAMSLGLDLRAFEAATPANDDFMMFTSWYPPLLESEGDASMPADEFGDQRPPTPDTDVPVSADIIGGGEIGIGVGAAMAAA